MSTVDYHTYPNKKLVMKAINGLDMIFSDEDGNFFQVKKNANVKKIYAGVITWRHQKNCRNGQQIRLLVGRDHPEACTALAIASMVLRKVRLRHNTKLPLAIFKAKDGTVQYLTHSKVTDIIRKAVKIVYPDISKKDLMMYPLWSLF